LLWLALVSFLQIFVCTVLFGQDFASSLTLSPSSVFLKNISEHFFL